MDKPTNRNSRGFTLLELMIGMAIFLIISGVVLTGMARLQATYRSSEMYTTMQQRLRATMQLMAQEIGQAGLQASTVEGGSTGGDATFTAPYKITGPINSTGVQNVAVTVGTGVPIKAYIGQWLMVDNGTAQEPVQVTGIAGNPSTVPAGDIQANFGNTHTGSSIQAYPMGVFPHGILSDQMTSGLRLTMFGEINGSGNGLYAVEYQCPATNPGQLMRYQWDLSQYNPANTPPLPAPTAYPLIDSVTQCYFCFPGSSYAPSGTNLCPTSPAAPQPVTLYSDNPASSTCTGPSGSPADTCTYNIITQVGFTVTVSESTSITGYSQPISITKSYSNIQPRNLITANNILNAACLSAFNAGNAYVGSTTCPSYTAYASPIKGELQPDPVAVGSVIWQ